MDLYQSFSSRYQYNRMRDRLIDLSREYSLDEIVRLERLGFRDIDGDLAVALATARWAMGTVLSNDELDTHIRRTIRQLDLPSTSAEDRDGFIIGASWDGCGDDEPERESRQFTDPEEMLDFIRRMEAEGRNPTHRNMHGPGGFTVHYDAAPEDED